MSILTEGLLKMLIGEPTWHCACINFPLAPDQTRTDLRCGIVRGASRYKFTGLAGMLLL